jgi:hypothetical protein
MKDQHVSESILAKADSNRRDLLKRVLTAGFATPVVAAFAIDALATESAYAQGGNSVPEVDGGTAGAAIALVAGAALIVKDRLK